MARRRMVVWGLLALSAAVLATLAGLYALNPFGAHSYDPRQRILGYALYRQSSTSMLPTLRTGTLLVSSAGYYRTHVPKRGDLVVFAPLQRPHEDWVKRIVGLPGERIAYRDGTLSIDGRPLAYRSLGKYSTRSPDPEFADADELEEALPGRPHAVLVMKGAMPAGSGDGEWTVPPGHYFVLGDNRDNSEDSRFFGPISRDALRGKVVGPGEEVDRVH